MPTADDSAWAEDLLDAIGPHYPDRTERQIALRYLRLLGKDDPHLNLHAQGILAGAEGSVRAAVARTFELILSEAIGKFERGASERAWFNYCVYSVPPRARHALSLAAAMASVYEACGNPEPDESQWRNLFGLAWNVNSDITTGRGDDVYFRGVAAYVMADPNWERMQVLYRPELKREATKFVVWAGAQDDIAAVVGAALDSGSIEPDTLAHLVGVRDGLEPALRGGAL